MRILHVLSQTELTGAEVYANNLSDNQVRAGHEVFLISDRLHVHSSAKFVSQPISKRDWFQRIKNILFLKKLIREEKIDIVHAHSRAASWVSYWSSFGTKTAYISTIHGRQHLHASLKLLDIYGDRVIAVCKNIKSHLIAEVGMRSEKIHQIPNGVEQSINCGGFDKDWKRIFLVGRTSGPKGRRSAHFIKLILPDLLEVHSDLQVSIAGGVLSNFDKKTRDLLAHLQALYPDRVEVREQITKTELTLEIAAASIVIGSGRLAVQALLAGKAVIALGEACCHGLITHSNYADAVSSNFGDILPTQNKYIDYELARVGIEFALSVSYQLDAGLREEVQKTFSSQAVFQQVESIYFEALLARRVPKRIPVLMYHKIVEDSYSSEHKTYITLEKFQQHLSALKRARKNSVTFSDIKQAALEGKALPANPVILTFDDGYRKSLQRALPLLKEFNFRAVFYVLGDRNLSENTWDLRDSESELISTNEMIELRKSGMELGAHSMTHRKFSELSEGEIDWELEQSKKSLESIAGSEVLSFAYPFGNLSEYSKQAARTQGFRFAVATDSGGRHIAADPFQIFRTSIFPQDGILQIKKKSSPFYRDYYFLKRDK